ncbi:Rv3235 family protein [Catenulispora subtropica]|uniref:Rv3235 family protein n=1 Tax=Catenulispora subtropica TaxID=450798 RepID=UPI0031D56ABE
MAPVRSVRAVGTAQVGTRWRRDNRPDFSGIAVWLDAVAEFEVEDETHPAHEEPEDEPHAEPVPWVVDAGSPEYAQVWRPLAGTGREPRPGLLVSVVRAGEVVAYPTPLADPPAGAVARAMARLKRPEPEPRRPEVLAAEPESAPAPPSAPRRPAAPRKDYGEVRALVGMLVEVLAGRRAPAHAATWATPEVRGKLRLPRFRRNATLKSVRLSDGGTGIEALALVRDGGRTRVVALRFDRADNGRWQCTALQTG